MAVSRVRHRGDADPMSFSSVGWRVGGWCALERRRGFPGGRALSRGRRVPERSPRPPLTGGGPPAPPGACTLRLKRRALERWPSLALGGCPCLFPGPVCAGAVAAPLAGSGMRRRRGCTLRRQRQRSPGGLGPGRPLVVGWRMAASAGSARRRLRGSRWADVNDVFPEASCTSERMQMPLCCVSCLQMHSPVAPVGSFRSGGFRRTGREGCGSCASGWGGVRVLPGTALCGDRSSRGWAARMPGVRKCGVGATDAWR